jgi:iron(III) transport system substrate-binding protein
MLTKSLPACLLAAAALAAASMPAQARTLAEIVAYQGPDRTKLLVEGAKKEGVVSVYGSTVPSDMNPVIKAFKAKYGIEFQYWRSSSENVLLRAVSDHRAGRCAVDAFATVADALEALHREKLLQAVKTPLTADLIPQAFRPHGEWVASRLNIFSAAYNTNEVKTAEAPKRYEDLKNPRWKGRLAIEANDVDWFGTIVDKMGRDKAIPLFKDIVKTNGISLRKGHTQLTNMVVAGDVPLALTVYSYKPEQLKRKGAPIEPLYLSPLIALGYGPAVSQCAPHPNAAVLFYDFLLSDGQKIMAKRFMAPTNPKVAPLPNGGDLTMIDPAKILDNQAQWEALWKSVIAEPK